MNNFFEKQFGNQLTSKIKAIYLKLAYKSSDKSMAVNIEEHNT